MAYQPAAYTTIKPTPIMTLQEILAYRRATRYYSSAPLDSDRVRQCLDLARLTPTSSNMQVYEMYHVTSPDLVSRLGKACLDQGAATTAREFVVFVVRQDLYRQRAKALLEHERANVQRNSPRDRWEHRTKRWEMYYGKLIPTIYARAFGLLGLARKSFAQIVGLFRPMVRQLSETDVRISSHQSCAMVAQTFMLAMAEQGYDTCPIGGLDSWRVKHLLGLPRRAEICMIVSCGIREARGIWGDRFRFPMEELYKRR